MTASEFKAAFPEFEKAPDALVNAKIRIAELRTNSTVWGEQYEIGVSYLAARLLALSPFGRPMQLVNKDGSTVYDEPWRTSRDAVASGYRNT